MDSRLQRLLFSLSEKETFSKDEDACQGKFGLKNSVNAFGKTKPLKEGANKGRSIDIEKMMEDYWEQFGWDTKT